MEQIVALPAHITLLIADLEFDSPEPAQFRLQETSPDLLLTRDTTNGNHDGVLGWRSGENELEIKGLKTSRDRIVQGAARLMQLDRDKNGYLDANEARLASRAGPLAIVDLNGDGKIVREELEASFVREAHVTRCWIEISLQRRPPVIWERLDTDRDERLGDRELRKLPQLLAEFDLDRDGAVAYHEMPFRFEVQIGRGIENMRRLARANVRQTGRPKPGVGPIWFQAMDANRDGDVSQHEFLGTARQFEQLDADHDGLIDPREAANVPDP